MLSQRFTQILRYSRSSTGQLYFSTNHISNLVKPITVRTCVGLYPRLQQRHPHIFPLKVPTDGIDLTVAYADTANERLRSRSDFTKTIVAISGTPGYYGHFDWLLKHYRGNHSQVRVVVPNFPDFTHTRSSGGIFWHTTEEKVAFLKDFLTQLNIQKIDCLVAHSMGFQAVTGLIENPGPFSVKSLALFAPQPLWDTTPPLKKTISRFFYYRNDPWYRLLELLKVHQKLKINVKFSTIDEFLWLMTTARDEHTSVDALRRIYMLKNQSKIPVIVQYGSKEPIVSKRAVKQMFQEFGFEEKDLIQFDFNDSRDPKEIVPVDGPRIRGYLVQGGGHFAFAKQSQVTIQMIENLLNYNN